MTERKTMGLVAFWRKYERTCIQMGTILILCIPLIQPLGLPIPIGKHTRAFYNIVDSWGPETKLLCNFNIGVGAKGETTPSAIASFIHLFGNNVKIYIVGFEVDGVNVILEPEVLKYANPEDYGYVYGEDWCVLGYIPGGAVAMQTFATDIGFAVQYDKYGNKIEDLPMMQGVNGIDDFDYIMDVGADWIAKVITYWSDPYDKPYIIMGAAMGISKDLEPFFKTGQLTEYIAGIRHGAEYEQLIKRPGLASASIDCLTLGHSWVLILVVLSNIGLFMKGRGGGK